MAEDKRQEEGTAAGAEVIKFSRTTARIQKEMDGRTLQDQQNDFLDQFEKCANVTKACKKAKVSRSAVYHTWMKDPEFKKAFDDSQKVAASLLEDEMVRRAHEGVVEPVYQGGKKVGQIRKYSDTLLIVLAKAHDPDRFKDRTFNEHTGKGGGPLKGVITHEIKFRNSKKDAPPPDEADEQTEQ